MMLNNSVFVYGTLLPGLHNHIFLLDGRLRKDNAFLRGYAMYDTGSGFPCIMPKEGHIVYGQVWDVSDAMLVDLDRLEGVPYLYTRNLCAALSDEMRDCWTYVWGRLEDGYHNTMPLIDHGSWMAHVMKDKEAA